MPVELPAGVQVAAAVNAAVTSLTVAAGEPGIDTATAGVLEIGGDNATTVEIGKGNVVVDASGNVAGRSFTASSSSPYVPSALAVAIGAAGGGVVGTTSYFPPPRGGGLDDSANMQAVINALSTFGGGEIEMLGAYTGNIVLKAGVLVVGPAFPSNAYGAPNPSSITAFGAGYVIDTPAGATFGCGVRGISAYGLGAGTAVGGIRFQNVSKGVIKSFGGGNFADEAVAVRSSSKTCTIEDVYVAGLANTTRGAVTGVVDIDGNDHQLDRIEATQQAAVGVSSGSLFCCGIVIRGNGHYVGGLEGEFSDQGIYVSASGCRFVLGRADNNWGHGWNVLGANNTFTVCLGANNSQDTTNTYDNWRADSTSAHNAYTGCLATNNLAKVTKYGFEDLVSSGNWNSYDNCFSFGTIGTQHYIAQSAGGSSFLWPLTSKATLTANSATPDVTHTSRTITANSAPTTITDFTGGVPGQRLLVLCNDANTTIQDNGTTIRLIGNLNKFLKSGVMYEFIRDGGLWREAPSSSAYSLLNISADNGDAAKALVVNVDATTQVWNTPLAAPRAVTLPSSYYDGATFRIVRTANATGASALNVGSGPLKALAVGQWCDVQRQGASGWVLTAFGSL